MSTVTQERPTPTNPQVYRLGRVERRFRALADELELAPGPLLEQLLKEGVTQNQLADRLKCTRQAVSVLARRYGLGFPGARIDLDTAAAAKGWVDFETYVRSNWGDMTQAQLAEDLGVSLSTVKRRIKKFPKD